MLLGLFRSVILGTFVAGAMLKLTDRGGETMMHAEFGHGLEAVGYGVFIPVFFVTSGLRFDPSTSASSARPTPPPSSPPGCCPC